ncbi:MAG TPA: hypothetical protein VGR13_06335 [Actinomycetota bacterium]|jgi:hypothetical protein|nr:hypothetical protein [Actinomycetota bacterium]
MEFAVRSTDLRFLQLLRRLLGRFRVDQGPTEILFSADCGIERGLPGGKVIRGRGRLYFQGLLIFKGGVQEEMAGRLVSGIRDWTNDQSNEFFRVRAGGVTLNGGALLLPSPPESHLPSLVARLVGAGAGYLGDEIINVDPVLLQAHPLPLPLLLDAQDLREFPRLQAGRERPRRRRPSDDVSRRPRRPVLLEEIGGSPAPASPIQWVVFPSFDPDGPTALRPLSPSEALFRLTRASLNLHIWRDRAFVLMQKVLEGTPTAELSVGSVADAAELLTTSLPSPERG